MRAAQRADCGVERVLIVDWDVHHGNGTQDIFYDDPSVLTFSIHRRDRSFYPPSGFPEELGRGSGEGFNINVGWSQKGMGDGDYVLAFARVLLPVVSLAFVQPCFDAQLSWQPPVLGLAALNIAGGARHRHTNSIRTSSSSLRVSTPARATRSAGAT